MIYILKIELQVSHINFNNILTKFFQIITY